MVNLKVFLYGALNFFAPQFGRRTPCWGTGESSKHGPAYKPFDLEQTIRAGQHGVHDESRRPVTPRQSSREQCVTIILWPVALTINWPHTQVLAKGRQRPYYAWPPIWMLARRTPPASVCVCVCRTINLSLEQRQGSRLRHAQTPKRKNNNLLSIRTFINKGYWGGLCGVAGRGEEGDKVLGHTLWGITWMCRQRFNGAREWWQPRWNCSVHVHWPNTINHKKESAIGFIDIACPCYCIMIIQSRK